MGYADRFYYGQSKLKIVSDKNLITITSGDDSWTYTGEMLLPGTRRYTLTSGEDTKDVYLGYGECKTVEF